jgi:hypothetical protein
MMDETPLYRYCWIYNVGYPELRYNYTPWVAVYLRMNRTDRTGSYSEILN